MLVFCITGIYAQTPCAEIESILVDACGTPEGKNEMVRFKVGANNLNTSNLTFTWDSNPWLGVCQNTKTALATAALNRTILNCGWLKEPVGGVLPAGSQVLFITSENMDTLANSFANLEDTLIVVFQCGNASSGHFRNYATGQGTRTTVLTFAGTNGCSNSATYEVDHLVGQNGSHSNDDGATVNITNSTATSYTNNGCNAPIPVMSIQILTPDTTICKGSSIQLRAIATNYKNVKWKGGSGTFSYVDSLNTIYTPAVNETYPITLTIKAYKKCTGDSLSDQIVISKYSNATTAGSNVSICKGNTTVITASGGTSYVWDASPYLSCTNCATPIASPVNTTVFYANVTDNHTCVNRDSVIVTVNPRDSLQVIAADTICNGGTKTIPAYSSNGYLWSPNTGISCTGCAAPVFNPASSAVYTLSSLGACPSQKTLALNVLPLNSVTISNTANTITCSVASVLLIAHSSNNNVNYNWGTGTASTYTATGAGTYTVTTTDAYFGCTSSASVNINQNTVTPDAAIDAHGSLTCSVGNITLNATSATPGVAFNWGNGNTSASYSVSTTGNYTVTVTNPANGCTATATTTVSAIGNTISLTVTPSSATCGNNNGAANANVSAGTPNYTYLWSTGNSNPSLSNLSTGNYSVTVTDANGCSASSSVTVASTGSLSISSSFTNTTCGLNNGAAAVNVNSGTPPYTYNWSNSSSTATLSNLTAGNYTLTVNDINNCSATASITVASSSVNPVTVMANNTIICASDSAQFCASGGFVLYQWNNGQTGICQFVHNAGNYYVTATDANNCTVESNHLALTVHPQPPVSISVNGDTLSAYNSVTYQWSLNNSQISGANTTTCIATQTGYYTVEVTDSNGCRAVSLPVQVIISDVNDISNEANELRVFPNPVGKDEAWLLQTGSNFIGRSCYLFDATGRLAYTIEIKSTHTEINVPVAKGVYLLALNGKSLRLVKW